VVLTDDETEQAARLLYEASQPGKWDEADENTREGYRIVVRRLVAEAFLGERTPQDVEAFLKWMQERHHIDRERERG